MNFPTIQESYSTKLYSLHQKYSGLKLENAIRKLAGLKKISVKEFKKVEQYYRIN